MPAGVFCYWLVEGAGKVLWILWRCLRMDAPNAKPQVLVIQSCPILWDPMDCSPPGSSVHGILQPRILEWVAMPFSRGSSQPRDRTQVSCIAGGFFTVLATKEAHSKHGSCHSDDGLSSTTVTSCLVLGGLLLWRLATCWACLVLLDWNTASLGIVQLGLGNRGDGLREQKRID